jgi:hypothetical protein
VPKVVIARDGDTLCGLAMAAGFLNCDPVRLEAANSTLLSRTLRAGDSVTIPDIKLKATSSPTTKIHKFVKKNSPPVSIRFVHGSPDKKYLEDFTTTVLNVSNYVTDKGGLQGDKTFPTGFGFDPKGHEDEDSFKVEVVDPTASGKVIVLLEALRAFYAAGGSLDHHDTFSGLTDGSVRKIPSLECQQVRAGHVAFRSKYLRLVVDNVDQKDQTLLVTDLVEGGDRQVEILDQNVRATYVVKACNAAGPGMKCQVTAVVPLHRGRFVDLAVRVLRATPSGVTERTPGGTGDDGSVKLADVRKRIDTFVRRCWAQAHIKPRIVRLQTMDLPSNMITVADANGLPSKGNKPGNVLPGQIGFTVNVQRFHGAANSTHIVPPFNVPAGSTPEQTANLIRAEIEKFPGLTATPSRNAPETGDPDGSCDVLISDASAGRITITNMIAVADQDEDQRVEAVSLGMTVPFRNAFSDYHVGHPEQRNLVKVLDTPGDVVIDIAVVDSVPGVRGFTVPEQKSLNANRQPVSGVKNSIIMPKISTDATTNNPFSLPHEIGHILTDEGLHARPATELMTGAGTSATSSTINDSKRMLEHKPSADNWDIMIQNANGSVGQGVEKRNATDHVNTTSAHLLRG